MSSAPSKTAALRDLFNQLVKGDRKKDAGTAANAWFFARKEQVEMAGITLTGRMIALKRILRSLIVGTFVQMSKGNDQAAWETLVITLMQFDFDRAQDEIIKEMRARAAEGDNAARKLLDFSQVNGEPLLLVKWSESGKRARLEIPAEWAARHLRAICLLKNEDLRATYRTVRESVIRHKWLTKEEAYAVTEQANAERGEREKAVKAQRLEREKAQKEAAKAQKPNGKAQKSEAKPDKAKPKTEAELKAAAAKKRGVEVQA